MLGDPVALLRTATRARPDDYLAHFNLAFALTLQESYEDAVREYRETIRLRPDRSTAHNNLAETLNLMGRHEEALAACRIAIGLRPDPYFYDTLGNTLKGLSRFDEAIAAYRESIRLRADVPGPHQGLAEFFFKQGRFGEAVTELRALEKIRPNDYQTHYRLGSALTRVGKPEESIAAYREAILRDLTVSHNASPLGYPRGET